MHIGVHLSIGMGLKRTAEVAIQTGCEAVQMFSGNPNSWHTPPLSPESAKDFVSLLSKKDIEPVVLHAPYLVNLAAPDPDILEKSRETVLAAFTRANMINARYIVTHVGSHKGAGVEKGIKTVAESVMEILGSTSGSTALLLETSNGSGNNLGVSFEELAEILKGADAHRERLGVCVDTAHIWAAGYDISSPTALDAVLRDFDRVIGLDRLHVIHANDSSTSLGSHRDVHRAPGDGQIGEDTFEALLGYPQLQHTPIILEMPRASEIEVVAVLKEMKELRSRIMKKRGIGPAFR